ncbi:MAG: hypothetical protein ACYDCK_01250 [Thermoplasmatota archaeon]
MLAGDRAEYIMGFGEGQSPGLGHLFVNVTGLRAATDSYLRVRDAVAFQLTLTDGTAVEETPVAVSTETRDAIAAGSWNDSASINQAETFAEPSPNWIGYPVAGGDNVGYDLRRCEVVGAVLAPLRAVMPPEVNATLSGITFATVQSGGTRYEMRSPTTPAALEIALTRGPGFFPAEVTLSRGASELCRLNLVQSSRAGARVALADNPEPAAPLIAERHAWSPSAAPNGDDERVNFSLSAALNDTRAVPQLVAFRTQHPHSYLVQAQYDDHPVAGSLGPPSTGRWSLRFGDETNSSILVSAARVAGPGGRDVDTGSYVESASVAFIPARTSLPETVVDLSRALNLARDAAHLSYVNRIKWYVASRNDSLGTPDALLWEVQLARDSGGTTSVLVSAVNGQVESRLHVPEDIRLQG